MGCHPSLSASKRKRIDNKHTRSKNRVRARVPLLQHLTHVILLWRLHHISSQHKVPNCPFNYTALWNVVSTPPLHQVKCKNVWARRTHKQTLVIYREQPVHDGTLKHWNNTIAHNSLNHVISFTYDMKHEPQITRLRKTPPKVQSPPFLFSSLSLILCLPLVCFLFSSDSAFCSLTIHWEWNPTADTRKKVRALHPCKF